MADLRSTAACGDSQCPGRNAMYGRAGDDGRRATGERNLRTGAAAEPRGAHWSLLVPYMHLIRTRACMSMIMLPPGVVPPYQGTLGAFSDLIFPADGVRWGPPAHCSSIMYHGPACASPRRARGPSSAVHAHGWTVRLPLWKGSCFARFGEAKGCSVRVFRAPGVLASSVHPSCFCGISSSAGMPEEFGGCASGIFLQ